MPSVSQHREFVGERIRSYRKAAGLSQEKLAELADLHFTTISQLENGKENISLDRLVRLAKALKVRVVDLVADL